MFLLPSSADAHPVPRGSHDRTILVQLAPAEGGKSIVVTVRYRLEVDELTVVLDDMVPFRDQVRFDRSANNSLEFFGEFTRIYAPILAGNLVAKGDGDPLAFRCEQRAVTKNDEGGKALGHLRCNFVFRAEFPLAKGTHHAFTFREGNYELKTGQIRLSLDNSSPIQILSQTAPDSALQARSPQELRPGDDDKLRELTVRFVCDQTVGASAAGKAGTDLNNIDSRSASASSSSSESGLLDLFLTSDHGVVVMLVLSALIGAAHALTPGHGKTLVAAYLVGQRGTVGQACVLGLVTAITHTGVVLLLAVSLLFIDQDSRQKVANTLGLAMGIILFCLGMWLLLQRLARRADHFHVAGHAHQHEPPTVPQHVGMTDLVAMGMTGGMIPCWDAVAMLGWGIGMNLFWLALPMLIAFSAGLAAVLVLVGILVVHARKLVDGNWSNSLVVRMLPIFSALFIAGMGFLVCYQGIHGNVHDEHAASAAALHGRGGSLK